MKINRDELAEILPQKGKMRLIDEIVRCDFEKHEAESRTKITDECIFFDKSLGGVPNYVLLEFASQTVAAMLGAESKMKNQSADVGFVLSVSNFHFDFDILHSDFFVNVAVALESEMGNVHAYCADFFIDGKKSGDGKLTLMKMEN